MTYDLSRSPIDRDAFKDIPDDIRAAGFAANQRIRGSCEEFSSLSEEISPDIVGGFLVRGQCRENIASFLFPLYNVCRSEVESCTEGNIKSIRHKCANGYLPATCNN